MFTLTQTNSLPSLVELPSIGGELALEINAEVEKIVTTHGSMYASAHEAHGVMYEELEEFWEIVRMKRRDRDPQKIREELIQVCATAIKAIHSIPAFVEKK